MSPAPSGGVCVVGAGRSLSIHTVGQPGPRTLPWRCGGVRLARLLQTSPAEAEASRRFYHAADQRAVKTLGGRGWMLPHLRSLQPVTEPRVASRGGLRRVPHPVRWTLSKFVTGTLVLKIYSSVFLPANNICKWQLCGCDYHLYTRNNSFDMLLFPGKLSPSCIIGSSFQSHGRRQYGTFR